MGIARLWQPECPLQDYLPGSVIQEVRAPYYVGHTLRGVIDHDRELVGEGAVAAPDDDVAALAQPEGARALCAILELEEAVIDAKARGGGTRAPRARAAGARISGC